MPSLITHALTAAGLTRSVYGRDAPAALYGAAVALSCLPDADVIGLRLGISYGDAWGHRGVSHSLAFAGLVSLVGAVLLGVWRIEPRVPLVRSWAFLFVVAASHGLLDAFTNGGHGIAFLWPFSETRFFWPWRPIAVSPIGISRFLSARGVHVLASEACWVWGPLAAMVGLAEVARWWRGRLSERSLECAAEEVTHG